MSGSRIDVDLTAIDFGTLGPDATSTTWENGGSGFVTVTLGGTFGGATVVVEGSDASGGPFATLTGRGGASSFTAAGVAQIDIPTRFWRVRAVGGSGTAVTAVATVNLSRRGAASAFELAEAQAAAAASAEAARRGETIVEDDAGTAWSFTSDAAGQLRRFTASTLVTVTLPAAALGSSIQVEQAGTGQVCFVAGANAAIVNRLAHDRTAGRYARAGAVVVSTAGGVTTWNLAGDTDA